MKSLTDTICRLLLVASLLLVPAAALAQGSDPIVGTWNMSFSQIGRPAQILAIMNFNAGGTTVEFDTTGTNPSASESIDLGVWSNTGDRTYTSRAENVTYDPSGNLSALVVGTCNLTLAQDLNSFTGTCSLNAYSCSVAVCPGPLLGGPFPYGVSARRF